MNRKNIILSGLAIGLLFSSLPQIVSFGFDHQNNRNDNLKIKTSELDESWNVSFNFFGLDMVIDLNNCIYVLAAENYAGNHIPGGYYGDLIILKYNRSGDQLWRVDLEGLKLDYSAITVDSEANLYLASEYRNQSITSNMMLVKFNSSGDLQWQQTWEGGNWRYIGDIAIDPADNIYIYYSAYGNDLFIVKYNSTGDQQWVLKYEGDHWGEVIVIDSDYNIIVSGASLVEEWTLCLWIRCYNQSGDLKWNISCTKGGFYKIALDSLNNVLSYCHSSFVKYDNLGNFIWACEHQIEFSWDICMVFDSFDNLYAAAIISIPEDHHNYDLYMVKINNSGSFEWYLTWGGSGDEDLMAIDIDSNNNIYLLSSHLLIKNPEHNGKSLTNIRLWNFYMILFGICFFMAGTSLIIIIKRKSR